MILGKAARGPAAAQSVIDKALELLRPTRMPELAERLGFDLPDPLASDLEVLPHLFEGVVALFPDPEALVMPLVGCGDGRPPVLGCACARSGSFQARARFAARARGANYPALELTAAVRGPSTSATPSEAPPWVPCRRSISLELATPKAA